MARRAPLVSTPKSLSSGRSGGGLGVGRVICLVCWVSAGTLQGALCAERCHKEEALGTVVGRGGRPGGAGAGADGRPIPGLKRVAPLGRKLWDEPARGRGGLEPWPRKSSTSEGDLDPRALKTCVSEGEKGCDRNAKELERGPDAITAGPPGGGAAAFSWSAPPVQLTGPPRCRSPPPRRRRLTGRAGRRPSATTAGSSAPGGPSARSRGYRGPRGCPGAAPPAWRARP